MRLSHVFGPTPLSSGTRNIRLLEKLAQHSDIPVINAMTDSNHPCEIIADMYALSKRRKDFLKDSYLFCGEKRATSAWHGRKPHLSWALIYRSAVQRAGKWSTLQPLILLRTPSGEKTSYVRIPCPGCSRGLQKLPGNQGSYGNGQQRCPAQSLSFPLPGAGKSPPTPWTPNTSWAMNLRNTCLRYSRPSSFTASQGNPLPIPKQPVPYGLRLPSRQNKLYQPGSLAFVSVSGFQLIFIFFCAASLARNATCFGLAGNSVLPFPLQFRGAGLKT